MNAYLLSSPSLFLVLCSGLLRLSPPLPHQGGHTPLHGACYGGHLEVARALMDNGADPRAKNKVSPYALPPYSHPACCWDVFFVDVFGVCVAAGGTCCSLVCE